MPLTEWQKNSIRQLRAKRDQLPPEQRTRLDELSKELDAEEGAPPVTAKIANTPAKPAATPPSTGTPSQGYIERAKSDLDIGWRAGMSDVKQTAANITTGNTKASLEGSARDTAPKPEELTGKTSVFDYILQGVGGLIPGLIKNAPAIVVGALAPESELGALAAPAVAGVIGGVGALNRGGKEAAKEAAESAVGWYGIEKAGSLSNKIENATGRVAARVAGGAAAMAIPAAVESGGDLRKTAAAAVLGGAMSLPGPKEFTPEMAKKALKGGKDAVEATADSIHRTLDPFTAKTMKVTEPPSKEFPSGRKYLAVDDRALYVKEVLTSAQAERARSASIARYGLKNAIAITGEMTFEEAYGPGGWTDAMETREQADEPGWRIPFKDEKLKSSGKVLGDAMKAKSRELERVTTIRFDANGKPIRGTGRLVDIIEGYLPRIFEDPAKSEAYMKATGRPVEDWPAGDPRRAATGRRPLGGPGNRFKARTRIPDPETGEPGEELAIPLMSQAIRDGIKPAYKNPGEMILAAMAEIDRAIMMEKVKNTLGPHRDYTTMRGNPGILKIRPSYQDVPSEGYEEMQGKDWIAYGLNQAGERVKIGRLDAPIGVAQVVKNHLSSGLSGKPWYRGLRAIGNAQNFATLGLSFYHAGMTAMQAVTSDIALGIEKIMEGSRPGGKGGVGMVASGLKDIATSPLSPFIDPFRAYSVRRELREPGSTGNPFVEQTAAHFVDAGGRDGLDQQYRMQLLEKMKEAHREGRTVASIVRIPGATLELFSKPILEHYVPLQKIAAFTKLAEFELRKLGDDATERQKTQAYQSAYRSVENRFGQLTYDNIFWDRTVKDFGMVVLRALGYKLGTWRELGGGAKDWATFMRDLPSKNKAEFTHRMAYTIAMPLAVATAGAITNYVMVGLLDPRAKSDPSIAYPKSLLDYFYPRIGTKDEYGRDERVQYPSYVRDVHTALGQGWTGPLQYLENSAHPLITSTFDLIRNQDWSHTQVVNGDDSLIKQLGEVLGYEAGQWAPIGVRNIERLSADNTPAAISGAALIGITVAPASIKRSDAENYAGELMAKEGKQSIHTQEDTKRRAVISDIRRAIKTGTDPGPFIQQGIKDGLISPYDLKKATKQITNSSLWMDLQWLDFDDALRVYIKATPEERASLQPLIAHKRTLWEREAGQRKNALEQARIMELWNKAIGVTGGR